MSTDDATRRALGLDDASLDAAWDAAVALLRAKHGVDGADAMLARAAANLSYWHDNPAPWDATFVIPSEAP